MHTPRTTPGRAGAGLLAALPGSTPLLAYLAPCKCCLSDGQVRYRARAALFTHTHTHGDSPLATSSFRVFHARRMSNAIIVADRRAVERYLGLHSPRQVGASDALHPIDERAGY